MTTGNLGIIQEVYRAFTAGDLDAFVELLDADFVSTQSDAVPWRGTYHGPSGVRDMFRRVGACAQATFEPVEVIDGTDGRIVVPGIAQVTPTGTGQRHAVRELHLWRVDHGIPRSLDVFLNAPAELLDSLAGRDRHMPCSTPSPSPDSARKAGRP